MNIHLRRKQLVIIGAAVAAGAVLAVSASAAANLFSDPARARLGGQVSPQTASSTAAGITLSVSEAIFSGTQTLLRLQAAQDGQPLDPTVYSLRPSALKASGFAQAQAPGGSQASDGARLLQLPPVLAPGPVSVTIDELVVRPPGATASVLRGPWQLDLTGVAKSDFAQVMRVEALAGGTIDVDGHAVVVTGYRSTSQTLVEYTAVDGLTELVPPRLSGKGFDRADPYEVGDAGGRRRAAFAPTPFGEPLSVAFGPFSRADAASQVVVINLAGALARASVSRSAPGQAPIAASDVRSGDGTIPVIANVGRYTMPVSSAIPMDFGRRNPEGTIDVLRLTLRGTWLVEQAPDRPSPYTSTPTLIDARGVPLRMLSAESGYSKDASGSIGPGQTTVEYFLEPDMDMTTVTLILGAPQRVLQGDWQVALHPPRTK